MGVYYFCVIFAPINSNNIRFLNLILLIMDTKALKKVSTQMINVCDIDLNDGQVEGLPKNPRKWSEDKLEKLRNSLDTDPEFMNYNPVIVYPLNGRYVVIGGNMRLSVCKEREINAVPCMVLPVDTDVEKLKRYTIKDNTTFGDWDWIALEEWDEDLLNDCGMEGISSMDVDVDSFFNDNTTEEKKKEECIKVVLAFGMEDEKETIKDAVKQALVGFIGVRVE